MGAGDVTRGMSEINVMSIASLLFLLESSTNIYVYYYIYYYYIYVYYINEKINLIWIAFGFSILKRQTEVKDK